MSIEVRVPTVLRNLTQGARLVQAEGSTVAAVIDHLEGQYPGLKGELLSEEGSVRQFVNIYLNDEDIRYLNRLQTPVSDGDRVAILPAVAGGARLMAVMLSEAKHPCPRGADSSPAGSE